MNTSKRRVKNLILPRHVLVLLLGFICSFRIRRNVYWTTHISCYKIWNKTVIYLFVHQLYYSEVVVGRRAADMDAKTFCFVKWPDEWTDQSKITTKRYQICEQASLLCRCEGAIERCPSSYSPCWQEGQRSFVFFQGSLMTGLIGGN